MSTVTLAPDDNQSGIYRGRTGPLAEGQYEVSVRASGFSNDALRARTGFLVQPPKSRERELVSCNDELLEEIARSSGGTFLREEQAGELADLLIPLSSGRIIESDTLLWQSYWWFAAIILLLSTEWLYENAPASSKENVGWLSRADHKPAGKSQLRNSRFRLAWWGDLLEKSTIVNFLLDNIDKRDILHLAGRETISLPRNLCS